MSEQQTADRKPNRWGSLHRAIQWWMDPVNRERAALKRAQRKGIAQKMSDLREPLKHADQLSIMFHSQRLEEYLMVLNSVASFYPTVPMAQPEKKLDAPASAVPMYVVSPASLAEAHAFLTRHPKEDGQRLERMLAVTGVKHGTLRTLEHLIEVKMDAQSVTSASFDMEDFARVAIQMHEQFGCALQGIYHNHPWNGPPTPSDTDWQLQNLLDQGGYPTVQCVFSTDGYLRFFANKPFTLTISGKGVDCVDPDHFLYRLTSFKMLPHPRHTAPEPRGQEPLRPIRAYRRR